MTSFNKKETIEDQLLILTLLQYYNGIHVVNKNELDHLNKSTDLYIVIEIKNSTKIFLNK